MSSYADILKKQPVKKEEVKSPFKILTNSNKKQTIVKDVTNIKTDNKDKDNKNDKLEDTDYTDYIDSDGYNHLTKSYEY
jgi:hypothetical protein